MPYIRQVKVMLVLRSSACVAVAMARYMAAVTGGVEKERRVPIKPSRRRASSNAHN